MTLLFGQQEGHPSSISPQRFYFGEPGLTWSNFQKQIGKQKLESSSIGSIVTWNVDPLCFLTGCHKRQLNQALSVLSLSPDFLSVSVVLLTKTPFALRYLCVLSLGCSC